LQFLHSAGDWRELVGLPLEEDGVVLGVVAAEAVHGRGVGEDVERLSVGVEEPALLRGHIPGLKALVEVVEVLDELQRLQWGVLADAEALPELGPPTGEERVGGPRRRETLPTATSRFWTEYQKSLPSLLAEASSMSCNAIIANWHWRSTSTWKCRIRTFSIEPPNLLDPPPASGADSSRVLEGRLLGRPFQGLDVLDVDVTASRLHGAHLPEPHEGAGNSLSVGPDHAA